MPPARPSQLLLGVVDKIAALMGGKGPMNWLTVGQCNRAVTLYEVGGRSYILLEIDLPKTGGSVQFVSRSHTRWVAEARAGGPGTLTTGGTDTDVTLTEVTDPAVKLEVVLAFVAREPLISISGGVDEGRPSRSMFVRLGFAKDDTPEGLAAVVPYVTVIEVASA